MKTNYEVAQAWSLRKRASSGNLSSDGVSIWSYQNWEVARHLDCGYQLLVNHSLSPSVTTSKHLGLVNSLDSVRPLLANHLSRGFCDKLFLGEPNWLWTYLYYSLKFPPGRFNVKLKPTAKFQGNGFLADIRDSEVSVCLLSLSQQEVGYGNIALYPDKKVEISLWGDKQIVRRISCVGHSILLGTVALSKLYLSDTPSVAIVKSSCGCSDNWLLDLFGGCELPYLANPRDYFYKATGSDG